MGKDSGKEQVVAELWETGKVVEGREPVLANIWDLEGEDKGKEPVLAAPSDLGMAGSDMGEDLGKEPVLADLCLSMEGSGREDLGKEPVRHSPRHTRNCSFCKEIADIWGSDKVVGKVMGMEAVHKVVGKEQGTEDLGKGLALAVFWGSGKEAVGKDLGTAVVGKVVVGKELDKEPVPADF
eukprot:TRINITY_DN1599_c2_g1_i6.p3 TRINITY_DN1599_c2_g1~~TRINITY_DN1599_c2_g1_i6.p3  ORF type:complete len:181 (-),score=54.78 TRINITY_DN1599_c2_g1_i6:258-800(-)